jgi:hypothetical protein
MIKDVVQQVVFGVAAVAAVVHEFRVETMMLEVKRQAVGSVVRPREQDENLA